MPQSLTELVKLGAQSVHQHSRHELILPLRRKLWKALGRFNTHKGRKRRYLLARSSVHRVLEFWSFDSTLHESVLDVAEQVFRGEVDRDTAQSVATRFYTFIQGRLHSDQVRSVYTAWAIHQLLRIALDDVDMASTTHEDDLDQRVLLAVDASYAAAAAYAGDSPRSEHCDILRLREFWLWYLQSAAPKSYRAV